MVFRSVGDPGSGTFLTPGFGIRNSFFRIQDPGSQTHIFKSFGDNFFCIKFYNSLKIGTNFYLHHFKNKIVQFCEIFGSEKKYNNLFFFHPCLTWLLLDLGSGMVKN